MDFFNGKFEVTTKIDKIDFVPTKGQLMSKFTFVVFKSAKKQQQKKPPGFLH